MGYGQKCFCCLKALFKQVKKKRFRFLPIHRTVSSKLQKNKKLKLSNYRSFVLYELDTVIETEYHFAMI